MSRKAPIVHTESERLRDRARWCRQLADGVGHPEFAVKLNALSREYELDAELREATESSSE